MTNQRRDPGKTALGPDEDGFSFTSESKKSDKKRPAGVYITKDQQAIIEHIANELGASKYAVMRFAIGYFLKAYQDNPGIMQVKTVTKQTIEQP
ncbi:MAG: hypothetical protein Q7U74_16160 [Saprospiraceae bacterium]|nr:hypothetical protein [Saprospiraceae bacterium]